MTSGITVLEVVIVLVFLVLITSGGQMAWHILGHDCRWKKNRHRQHGVPAGLLVPSYSLSAMTAAVLSLLLAAGGTLVLFSVSILFGIDVFLLHLLLARAMVLLCSLLFAHHVCVSVEAYFSQRINARTNSLQGHHAKLCTNRTLWGLGCLCRKVIEWLVSTLEGYLWTATIVVTVISLLQSPRLFSGYYPCFVPVTLSESWVSNLYSRDMGGPGANVTNYVGPKPAYPTLIDSFVCSGTCAWHSLPEILLYCAFFPPLLLYIILRSSLSYTAARAQHHQGILTDSTADDPEHSRPTDDTGHVLLVEATQNKNLENVVMNESAAVVGDIPSEGCSVCPRFSLYVLLVGIFLLAQCFLVWPLYGAVVWRRCAQLKLPSTEFLFLPYACGLLFVYRGIVHFSF